MEIPERFIDAIDGDPRNCLLIVGAGLSKRGVRSGGGGLPDWDQLMEAMIDRLKDDPLYDVTRIEQLRAMLREDRHLDVAEEFWKAHEHDHSSYGRFLRRHLKPSDIIESELHQLILDIGFFGVVSYNFDRVFERQRDILRRVVYPDFLQDPGSFQTPGFFLKIHGCIDRSPDDLVLTRTSFEKVHGDPRYSQIVETLLFSHPVLCVGFSLRDPNFRSILERLNQKWHPDLPQVRVLMQDPGQSVIADWRRDGIDLLPYTDHKEIHEFLVQLAALKDSPSARRQTSQGATKRLRIASGPIVPDESFGSGDRDAASVRAWQDWSAANKIEAKDRILSAYLGSMSATSAKEKALFKLAAFSPQQAVLLTPHMITVGTPACFELVRVILRHAAAHDRLREFPPHPMHSPVHRWLLDQDQWTFEYDELERILAWLLQKEWSNHGVDLRTAFGQVLSRITSSDDDTPLDALYRLTGHIEGASDDIEKVVLADGFVRVQDRADQLHDQHLIERIKEEKCRRRFLARNQSPAEMLAMGASLDDPKSEYCPCLRVAVQFLLTDFVHRRHLGIHGGSSLYDPPRANEIVDSLAGLRLSKQQMTVLWAINHWAEDHRGLGSVLDDAEVLRRGLLVPLWWRYSSQTRVAYLKEHHRGLRGHFTHWSGQEFLLEDLMGLRYDADREFRKEFDLSLGVYCNGNEKHEDRYDPFALLGLWSDRELSYEITDEPPPELLRRVVLRRIDWTSCQQRELRWNRAREASEEILGDVTALREYVSAERSDYIIDKLLGAYDPLRRVVSLYDRMIRLAATELKVDEESLSTIVYIHVTVHAFMHLGRDLSGKTWGACPAMEPDAPEEQIAEAQEAVAQLYAFRLLESLNDKRLLEAFIALEKACQPIYRIWRRTEDWSLEKLRAAVLRQRSTSGEWPPISEC